MSESRIPGEVGHPYVESVTSTPLRSGSSRAERFEERRTQLAQSALETLGELGYARASLREIAQNSEFTHGVVHYYFADKVELITHCVQLYKEQAVNRFDEIVLSSRSAPELIERFAAKFVQTMTTEAPLHRLWYDLRTQSMFEDSFRDDVLEIDSTFQAMTWRVMARYAALAGGTALLDERATYALFDGLFEHALLRHLAGDPGAAADLSARVHWLLPRVVALDV
jgi:TetR/AcrR family transcriptional regulator, transcriptional repressor of bet genes